MKNIIFNIIRKVVFAYPALYTKLKRSVLRYPAEHFHVVVELLNTVNFDKKFNTCIIDVGAYDGKSCIYWSKHFPDFNIYGFEPNIQMKNIIERNCKSYSNIKIFNYALGYEFMETDLYVTKNLASSTLNKINIKDELFNLQKIEKVKVYPLDQIIEIKNMDNIALLKLDAQGYEFDILKGANQTLSKTYVVLTEMTNHNIYGPPSFEEIHKVLKKNGFELYDIIPSLYGFDLKNYKSYNILKNQIIEWDAIYINKNIIQNSLNNKEA